ncbi:MAG: 1-acyl-sn-glycerol-3-phosphate acyltransferase [Acidobacteria bacterium]|nr:MAG: 1-acyl-sn-glycerol-3-phosphate acyltransferase [Acidobacteriota bacterium]PIE90960.1 MAG: 1-acyl-sn-glycerol-3-phosphate acyltransferase [Acidobacteriota bacterium]
MKSTDTVQYNKRRRNRFIWLLYQPYKWLILFPYGALANLFFGFWAILFAFLFSQRLASTLVGRLWARSIAFLTPISVTVEGSENIEANQSYVIVSNHQSIIDILVLYGWLDVDFKWVMKKELRKVPGLGIACEKLGHIFIDRSNRLAAIKTLNESKHRIANGTSVIFFPEGTRSRRSQLRPFKKGAFHIALDLNLPVLPVTISGTREIHPTHTFDTYPGKASLTIHPSIDTKQYQGKIDDLIQEARQQISSALPVDEH